jgi:hypothetical protein
VYYIGFALLSGVWLVPTATYAQVTDAAATVASLLNSYGTVPVTVNVSVPVTRQICRQLPTAVGGGEVCRDVTVNTQQAQTSQKILEAGPIRIIASSPVVYGIAVRTELPDQMIAWDQQVINCAKSGDASTTVLMSKQVQHAQSLAVSKSVTNTLGGQIGLTYGVPGVFSVGGQLTVSAANTSGTIDTVGRTDLDVRSGSATVIVPAKSVKIVEMRVWPIKFEIAFRATVTVDASLSTNDQRKGQLSEIFDEARRTFPLEGKLSVEQASDAQIVIFDGKLDPRDCSSGASSLTVRPANINQGERLRQIDLKQ